MSYRHTLKTFTIDRLPDEDHGEFMDRVDIITNARISILNGDLNTVLDEHTTFVFDEKDTTPKGTIVAALVEIHEVPQEITLNNFILLKYHNAIKRKNSFSGVITDIDLDESIDQILEQRNIINQTLDSLIKFKQRTLVF